MTGDLGALGFWLMLGMVLAAGTVSEALKARDKERERQATLRALLEKDSSSVVEVLAYLRERDAEERKLHLKLSGMDWSWPSGTRTVAMGILAFMGVIAVGLLAGLAVHYGLFRDSESALIPLMTMVGIWAAGGTIIAWRMWRRWPSGKQKNDAHPAA
jgi:hypothetical protein